LILHIPLPIPISVNQAFAPAMLVRYSTLTYHFVIDSSLWDEDSSAATNLISLDSVTDSVADSTTDAANTVTATTSEYGMVDSDIWADNFQDCPVSQVVMNEVTYNMGNATENAKFGLDAMGAVELDFTCAGMC
jgi:hypothetical protein